MYMTFSICSFKIYSLHLVGPIWSESTIYTSGIHTSEIQLRLWMCSFFMEEVLWQKQRLEFLMSEIFLQVLMACGAALIYLFFFVKSTTCQNQLNVSALKVKVKKGELDLCITYVSGKSCQPKKLSSAQQLFQSSWLCERWYCGGWLTSFQVHKASRTLSSIR